MFERIKSQSKLWFLSIIFFSIFESSCHEVESQYTCSSPSLFLHFPGCCKILRMPLFRPRWRWTCCAIWSPDDRSLAFFYLRRNRSWLTVALKVSVFLVIFTILRSKRGYQLPALASRRFSRRITIRWMPPPKQPDFYYDRKEFRGHKLTDLLAMIDHYSFRKFNWNIRY